MTHAMRLLVLGGTSWLGGAVAASARARGHDVTCLARGRSGTVPDGVRHATADRWDSSAYAGVSGVPWDGVVDVSWQPDLVRSALVALADQVRHWVYVSSVSVYADHSIPGADESAELVPSWTGTGEATRREYGEAKVSCETACRDLVDEDRLLVARPGLIVGHGDLSDRFGYWPGRFARASDGDEVLAPPLESAVQVVDGADLADWMVRVLENRLSGTVDAVGDPYTFADLATVCASATGTDDVRLVTPGSAWLEAQQVEPWAGPESLPLWLPVGHEGMPARSGRAGREAGLSPRSLDRSVESALAWERELGLDRARVAGLSPAREADLLDRWRSPV